MEQRSLLASALGVGVGVGLGLASARWGKPAHAAEGGGGGASGAGVAEVEAELRRLVVDGRNSGVSFDEFHHLHCYLRLVNRPSDFLRSSRLVWYFIMRTIWLDPRSVTLHILCTHVLYSVLC